MTPQERDLLTRFLDDLSRAQPGAKDAEAADQIDRALRSNPNAGYVLVQHAIVADAALHDAQARVADLERQLEEGGRPSAQEQPSFLGSLFGRARPNDQAGLQAGVGGPWNAPASAAPATGAPPMGYGGQGYAQGSSGPFTGGGGLGSFLRSAGTTAAGVAGGAFLFEGLNGLFGGGERREGFAGLDDGDRQGFADDGGFDIDSGGGDYS